MERDSEEQAIDKATGALSSAPRYWHVGLTVTDMERSLHFYRDLVCLRLEQLRDHVSADFDRLADTGGGTAVRVAWLTDGPFMLQLIQYLRGGGDALVPGHNRSGSPHLSFFVDDVDAVYARMRADGTAPLTTDGPISMGRSARSFYASDPDGVPVEFWQWTDPAMAHLRLTP